MKRKKKSFNRLYGDDAKSVMYATANKLAQKEQVHKVMYYKDFIKLVEGNPTTRMLSKAKTKTTGNMSADRGTDEKANRAKRKSLEKDFKRKASVTRKVLVNINIPQVKVQDVRCHTKRLLQKECLRDVSAKSCVASVESMVKNQ